MPSRKASALPAEVHGEQHRQTKTTAKRTACANEDSSIPPEYFTFINGWNPGESVQFVPALILWMRF